VQPAAFTWRP
jgi:hypothetical protein